MNDCRMVSTEINRMYVGVKHSDQKNTTRQFNSVMERTTVRREGEINFLTAIVREYPIDKLDKHLISVHTTDRSHYVHMV